MEKSTKITKNLILSMSAQVISILTSFVMGFIVPKFLDKSQYANRQTFLLYFGYALVLNLGLLDGIALRYSQYDYDQLDKTKIRTQFQALLWFTSIICTLTCLISACFLKGEALWIVCLVSVGFVARNIFTFEAYTFQITNRIPRYAFTIILQKAIFALMVIVLLLLKVKDFYWYCIAELLGDLLSFVIASLLNRGLHFGKILPLKSGFKEVFSSVSAGIFLMIANISCMSLVGGAKMVIQWRWSKEFFANLSFAFSISNLFLIAVSSISIVLFPSLKRMKEEEIPNFYGKIRGVISPLLLGSLLLYFPVCWILKMWIPKYVVSLGYLGMLLPMIVFSCKVSLLTNNYLKVYRKEKTMFAINMIFVALGVTLFAVSAYVFNSVELLLFFVVAMIMLTSIVSEIVVMSLIKKKRYLDFIIEVAIAVSFVLIVKYLDLLTGSLAYLGVFTLYLLVNLKSIKRVFKGI